MPDAPIGRRVRLEYEDQNESFARHLPVEGTIAGRCIASPGSEDWLVVELDAAIDYQHDTGVGSQPRSLAVARVLIRSRWASMPVAPGASTSVFLLLVEPSQEVPESGLIIDDFIHACWARCHVLQAE
jgi:hypothetical protein